MPADFFIDAKQGMVYSKATGVLGYVETLDHVTRLKRHPDFRPEFNQLFDFRPVTKVELSTAEVKEIASHTIFNADSKRAFVVGSDLQFGLSRMFGTYREMRGEKGIVIFRVMRDALSWLSLSDEPDPKLFKLLRSHGGKA